MSERPAALRLTDLAPAVRALLASATALSHARGEPLHLVGGLVRDLLLGRPGFDVDLVVVGDGLAFAREWAGRLDVPCRCHRDFLTAQLDVPAVGTVDVATARRETYPSPAALPVVTPATLGEDLGRRDFAVNAMAVRLDGEEFLDPWNGLADLAARRLRVLHPRSFEDDPTRILRGVRLGARLGFGFDAETADLACEAITNGAFTPLSGARLAGELALLAPLAGSAELGEAFARLGQLSFFGAVLGLAAPPPATVAALGAAPGGGDPWLRLLLTLGRGGDEEALADRLHVTGERRRRLVGANERAQRARRALGDLARRPSQVHEALAELGDDELALLASEPPPVGPRVRDEIVRMRPLTLTIHGRDLLAHGVAPGPRVGRVLAEVRRGRLDGELAAEEELGRALAVAKEAE
ncbi:MAG: hypothetical protein SF066_00250 [Thermoanaerobaculia bacterium]|nr:hypothetical protein [Thermoanaerobaculia bacterium]